MARRKIRRTKRNKLSVEQLDSRVMLDGSGVIEPVFFGPTPYLSAADTPASFMEDITGCPHCVHEIEDFEDGTLDFGLSISSGSVLGPSSLTDSVDSDDGNVDGFGTAGNSWFAAQTNSITITFPTLVQSAGLVLTDADITSTDFTLEAFDHEGTSLGTMTTGDIADDEINGTTGEDRFLGASFGDGLQTGITSITLTATGASNIEIDHIQFANWSANCLIDLELTKEVSEEFPQEGESVTWLLTITNNPENAATTATGVTVRDTFPDGLTYLSDNGEPGEFDSASGIWNVPDLAPGESATLEIETLINFGTADSTIVNSVEVFSANETDFDSNPNDSSEGAGGDDEGAASLEPAQNEVPVIVSDGGGEVGVVRVVENQVDVTTVEANDTEEDESTALVYAIDDGADQAAFSIDSSTGDLTFNTPPTVGNPADANGDNTYEVVVSAADPVGQKDTQTLLVTVTASPIIQSDGAGPTATFDLAENILLATTVVATDGEDDIAQIPLQYAITGGLDASSLSLAATGELTFNQTPNFESPGDTNGDNVYLVEVTVTDSDGLTDAQSIAITIVDANDAPVVTSDGGGTTGQLTVIENSTAVTTVTGSDEDAEDTFSPSISGGADAASFEMVDGVVSFIEAPNFEDPSHQPAVYELEVAVTDAEGAMGKQLLTVSILDVPELPEITSDGGGSTALISIEENSFLATTVGATDQDDDFSNTPLNYSITGGEDGAAFSIGASSGQLTFQTSPDFENPADVGGDRTYEVEVTVTDSDGMTDSQVITFQVTDVNDQPTIVSDGGTSTTETTVAENETSVTTVSGLDDEDGNSLTYGIAGGEDAGLFTIDPTSGALSFANAPNFESPANGSGVYEVVVSATDSGGLSATQTIAVSVSDVPEPPTIDSPATASVAENSTVAATVSASDDDDDASETPLVYSITGGVDQNALTIDSTSGEISFVSPPNFEAPADTGSDNMYDVEVTVTDSDQMTDVQAIKITVTDVNEPPTIVTNGGDDTATVDVLENDGFVTTVAATDIEDSASSLLYSISGGTDLSSFTINATTGELSFVSTPDFEAPGDSNGDNVYEIEVTASDSGGQQDSQLITVNVVDVFEPIIDLEVGTVVDRTSVSSDKTVVWTVSVTNNAANANVSATDVTIANITPDNVSFTPAASAGTFDGADWVLSEIAPGQTETLTLTGTVTSDFLLGETLTHIAYLLEVNEEVDVDSTPGTISATEDDTQGATTSVGFGNEPANVTVTGDTVIAVGRPGDDNIVLDLGETTHVLDMNGEIFTFDAAVIDEFHIGGSSGDNEVSVIGTALDDDGVVFAFNGGIISSDYSVNTYSFQTQNFEGDGGDDYFQAFGSDGDDVLAGLPADSTLTTPAQVYHMTGFERVDAFGRGGNDVASVYGTLQDDDFYAFETHQTLVGPGMYQVTKGFERVDAFGRAGNDESHGYDGPGDDFFYAFDDYQVLQYASGQLNVTKGFELSEAFATDSGNDEVRMVNLFSDNHFWGRDIRVAVSGPTRFDFAEGFESVVAEAEDGETPSNDVDLADIAYALTTNWL